MPSSLMCVLSSEQGLDLSSLPAQASTKSSAKILDTGLANPSFLYEARISASNKHSNNLFE